MGITDKFGDMADKAKDALGANKDKVDDAVETAGDKVDEKTGGKYTDKVDKAQQTASGGATRTAVVGRAWCRGSPRTPPGPP